MISLYEWKKTLGIPDSVAVDTQGGYCCALHGAGAFAATLRMGRSIAISRCL